MKSKMEDVVAELEKDAAIDLLGLWEVIKVAKEIIEEEEDGDIESLTFDLLRLMLSRGFRAGYLARSGSTLELWPDQSPNYVTSRIKTEWHALGREPNIGDIVWFDHNKQA